MKKEKSCGAVVYKIDNGKRLYLIEKMKMGHYSLPKGHVEENETEIETAKREIMEETSLEVIIDSSFREVITYSPKEDSIKDVIYFIGKVIGGTLKNQECEVSEIYFLELNDALDLLTYENDKNVLKKANEYLK